ncbi:MAG: hypothetical protein KGJ62_05610 [Armatimonadetes bacterium]|nr:hypothetical protein [Armatimonadota bacterium]
MLIDTSSIEYAEFAVALLTGEDRHYHIPVTPAVTNELTQMLKDTLDKLGEPSTWETFDCAEQYGSIAPVKCSVDDPVAAKLKSLITAENIPVSADALSYPSKLDFYFAKLRDKHKNECVGVRRASYFKRTIGKKLMHILNGQLDLITDNVFKLDPDFDLIIFPDTVAILRPTQFEWIADLEAELIKVAPGHVHAVAAAVPFLSLDFAIEFVKVSARGRRLFAAIRARNDISGLSADRFRKACEATEVELIEVGGKLSPRPKHEIKFLELLDRRLYPDPLADQQADTYRAASRKKVAP